MNKPTLLSSNELEIPTSNIIADFLAAQKEMKTAIKSTPNPYFKSKYADLSSIDQACRGSLHKYGFSISQQIDFEGPIDFIRTVLIHSSGESMQSRCRIINPKGDSQGFGSAITYSRRYSLAAICGVVTEDDDGNHSNTEPPADEPPPSEKPRPTTPANVISAAQAKRGYAIAKSRKWTDPMLAAHLKKWGVNRLEEMNWRDYKEAFPDNTAPKTSTWDQQEEKDNRFRDDGFGDPFGDS